MGNYQETYEKNRRALGSYHWWRYKGLPDYWELTEEVRQVDEALYTPTNINTRPFFRDLSKPLLVKNERNSYHFGYLVDNVRASEDYGGDNHIYMYYDSMEELCRLMQVVDITPFLVGKKLVFILGEEDLENYYPLDFKKEYGIDYETMGSKPLRVEEIQRIVVNSMKKTLSGNFFFAEVLDFHPTLLTLPGFGLSDFGVLYIKMLRGLTVENLRKKLFDNESPTIRKIIDSLFISTPYAGYLETKPGFDKFITILEGMFPPTHLPTAKEWFVSIYLAYNVALRGNINSRISPAIVFSEHGITTTGGREKKQIIGMFPYKKLLIIFRNPIIAIGSRWEGRIKLRPKEYSLTFWFNGDFLKQVFCLYTKSTDKYIPYTKVIRFEDLKLEPKATLESLCDFFDLPWSDMLLKVTCNGRDFSMSGDITSVGIKGFDTRPVYNRHERVISEYDYYRLSLLISDVYAHWGYKIVNKDRERLSNTEILELFKKSFRYEDFNYTYRNITTSISERKALLTLVEKALNQDWSKLVPIPWLKPKAEYMKGKLYE